MEFIVPRTSVTTRVAGLTVIIPHVPLLSRRVSSEVVVYISNRSVWLRVMELVTLRRLPVHDL